MLQILYNPNNAMIMDLSCNENILINFNHNQLTIFYNFGLVIYAEAMASKAKQDILKTKANKLALRPSTNVPD